MENLRLYFCSNRLLIKKKANYLIFHLFQSPFEQNHKDPHLKMKSKKQYT